MISHAAGALLRAARPDRLRISPVTPETLRHVRTPDLGALLRVSSLTGDAGTLKDVIRELQFRHGAEVRAAGVREGSESSGRRRGSLLGRPGPAGEGLYHYPEDDGLAAQSDAADAAAARGSAAEKTGSNAGGEAETEAEAEDDDGNDGQWSTAAEALGAPPSPRPTSAIATQRTAATASAAVPRPLVAFAWSDREHGRGSSPLHLAVEVRVLCVSWVDLPGRGHSPSHPGTPTLLLGKPPCVCVVVAAQRRQHRAGTARWLQPRPPPGPLPPLTSLSPWPAPSPRQGAARRIHRPPPGRGDGGTRMRGVAGGCRRLRGPPIPHRLDGTHNGGQPRPRTSHHAAKTTSRAGRL